MTLLATVRDIAGIVDGEIEGPEDLRILGFGMLDEATEGDLTFVGDGKHARNWAASNATAALVSHNLDLGEWSQATRAVIRVKNADHAMIVVLEELATSPELPTPGVDKNAVVHPSSQIGENVHIGPFAVIEADCKIGDGTIISSGVKLQQGVTIGKGCQLFSGVVIYHRCVLGDRVILHAHSVIGADGFGYRPSPDGTSLLKIPHIGNVVLGDDVEIGANSCIDRGKLGSTTIGAGTKIDNLCQIGHNCRIGRHCILSGLVGVGGSTRIGDGAMIGGSAGIADHLVLGNGIKLAAGSGLMRDIPDGEIWGGIPARDARSAWREHLSLRDLPSLSRRIKKMIDND